MRFKVKKHGPSAATPASQVPKTPSKNLHDAAAAGDTHQVLALLNGAPAADVTRDYKIYEYSPKNSKNVTPLACAIAFNHPTVAQILISSGADLRPPTHPSFDDPWPLIHIAINQPDATTLVDLLLRTGQCDVNESFMGESPLREAVRVCSDRNDIALLERLLAEPDIDVHGAPEEAETPVHAAVGSTCVPALEALLAAGGDPNAMADISVGEDLACDIPEELKTGGGGYDETLAGFRPLHLAAWGLKATTVGPLVEGGADPDATCALGYPAMTTAILCSGDGPRLHAFVRALLDNGANPNALCEAEEPEGRLSPLYFALREGYRDLCNILIAGGGDVGAAAPNLAFRMLHDLPGEYYHYQPDSSVINKLVKMRLEVLRRAGGINLATAVHPDTGRLLLHEAASEGLQEAVVVLVNAGSDATARDVNGHTALELLLNAAGEFCGHPWQEETKAQTVVALVKSGDLDPLADLPYDFKGLECLLGYLHETAPEYLEELFPKLPGDSKACVREVLRVLHRHLPGGEGLEAIKFQILGDVFQE